MIINLVLQAICLYLVSYFSWKVGIIDGKRKILREIREEIKKNKK